MARSTPYTKTMAVIDIILTLLTGGFWLFVVVVRELYKRQ